MARLPSKECVNPAFLGAHSNDIALTEIIEINRYSEHIGTTAVVWHVYGLDQNCSKSV